MAGTLDTIREDARGLDGNADWDPLLDRVGDARIVLLGEASHGTSEYYRLRAELTRRLLDERGFSFVAVEGDWPDCFRINRWAKGADPSGTAEGVLREFARWPQWMWANREVAEFLTWLRHRNDECPPQGRVGFYGLDVYSLWESMRALMAYLAEHEPEAVDAARAAWRCFEPYGEDPQEYARATRLVPTSCEDEVVSLLAQLPRDAAAADDDEDARFDAEQNAAVAVDAERYYRAMVRGGTQAWNLRDTHMADTVDRLLRHGGPDAKAVVWAHNTHVGDARATDMAAHGATNLGQLLRERHGADQCVLVGLGSHRGTVTAAPGWGEPPQAMEVPPARRDSLERALHDASLRQALFVFGDPPTEWQREPRPHRAIGVVYNPAAERAGNYVPTVVGDRYDAFCYVDQTTALEPLDTEGAAPSEEQETYPFAR